MYHYRFATTVWKAIWTYLTALGVVGASEVAAVGAPDTWDAFRATWPAFLIALVPALWRALENVRKNAGRGSQPLWRWPWSAAAVVVLCCVLSGCLSTSAPWYANPAKSLGSVEIEEPEFKLRIKDSGDGSFLRSFSYRGQGAEPWLMELNADHELSSPALTVYAEACRDAVNQVPALAETIIPAIGEFPTGGSTEDRATWVELLFGFLGQNPNLIGTFLGALL